MSWENPTLDAFEGFNQLMGQVAPYLFPILLILFIGSLVVFIGKKVVGTVS